MRSIDGTESEVEENQASWSGPCQIGTAATVFIIAPPARGRSGFNLRVGPETVNPDAGLSRGY